MPAAGLMIAEENPFLMGLRKHWATIKTQTFSRACDRGTTDRGYAGLAFHLTTAYAVFAATRCS